MRSEGQNMEKIKSISIMHMGIILLSIGVYFFKIPNGFSTGGVTGIGTILGNLTPITSSSWIWLLNAALLILSFIFLVRKQVLKRYIAVWHILR